MVPCSLKSRSRLSTLQKPATVRNAESRPVASGLVSTYGGLLFGYGVQSQSVGTESSENSTARLLLDLWLDDVLESDHRGLQVDSRCDGVHRHSPESEDLEAHFCWRQGRLLRDHRQRPSESCVLNRRTINPGSLRVRWRLTHRFRRRSSNVKPHKELPLVCQVLSSS